MKYAKGIVIIFFSSETITKMISKNLAYVIRCIKYICLLELTPIIFVLKYFTFLLTGNLTRYYNVHF